MAAWTCCSQAKREELARDAQILADIYILYDVHMTCSFADLRSSMRRLPALRRSAVIPRGNAALRDATVVQTAFQWNELNLINWKDRHGFVLLLIFQRIIVGMLTAHKNNFDRQADASIRLAVLSAFIFGQPAPCVAFPAPIRGLFLSRACRAAFCLWPGRIQA
jgi:hypothetical protein